MSVFALSIHADYGCRRSGACCTSDWDVPVEAPIYRSLDDALAAGRLSAAADAHDGDPPLLVEEDLPDDAGAMVARTSGGDCVFYHRSSGLCVIHRDLGEPMLPSTCRHFPRLAICDGRGTFIALSHYCPTAATLLFRDDVPLEIVEHPAAFPNHGYDGLIVTSDDWPPLLRPTKLMDLESYGAWERHMVKRCADVALTTEGVLATIVRDARIVRAVNPVGSESLVDVIALLPERGTTAAAPETLDDSLARYSEVLSTVPQQWKPAFDEAGLGDVYRRDVLPYWQGWHSPLKRYLAAKAFASWTAYQGQGLLTLVRGLDAAIALVRVEAARQCRIHCRPLDQPILRQAIRLADFLLNHLAVGDELAHAWSRAEIETSGR